MALVSGSRKPHRAGFLGVAVAALALCLLAFGYALALPGVADAETRVDAIMRSHGGSIRVGLPLPSRLSAAVMAIEDKYFYTNAFVNFTYGAARASVSILLHGGDPGGSTIAQQLAKQLYPHDSGFRGTLEEIVLGFKLSLAYSHAEVLDMYLDSVYFGNGNWGAEAASQGYFGVEVHNLSWGEAALLAGLLQAPSQYNPARRPRLAKERERRVIDCLVRDGSLTREQGEEAFNEPMRINNG